MAKTTDFEADLLKLIFNGTPVDGIAGNDANSPITEFYVGLYTDDPGADGDQTVNEISYTGYQRVAVQRNTSGWTVDADNARVGLAADLVFPTMTGGTGGTATFIAMGTNPTGAGQLFYRAALAQPLIVAEGDPPRVSAAESVTTVALGWDN
jgi:hypothetical protein